MKSGLDNFGDILSVSVLGWSAKAFPSDHCPWKMVPTAPGAPPLNKIGYAVVPDIVSDTFKDQSEDWNAE